VKSESFFKPSKTKKPPTNKMKTKIPYQITVAWSAADDAYEARVPALKHVLGYGDTPEKAVKEVKIAAELSLEALEKTGKPIPATDTALERLAALAPVLNISAVARAAGLSVQTLASKVKRGTALTEDEAARIGGVLSAHGVAAG
jgi:predicted RNase H-like HicB family nuclease